MPSTRRRFARWTPGSSRSAASGSNASTHSAPNSRAANENGASAPQHPTHRRRDPSHDRHRTGARSRPATASAPVRSATLKGGSVRLQRTYDSPIEDVWEALTTPDRISRWFLPISGDYRLGGRYQLEGNAGGEILECDRPRLVRVSWVFGEMADAGPDLRGRRASDAGRSRIHDGRAGAHRHRPGRVLGPVRTGRGWRRLGRGRSRVLAPFARRIRGVGDAIAWQSSAEGREFFAQSSAAWGAAYAASGADPDAVEKAVANTTAFYAPEPQETPS